MSCQQVPRLTEDPYVFTETVPTTPVLFSPQKSRHQQQHSKPSTQTTSLSSSTQNIANSNGSQQLFGGRFNGTAIETPSASITQQQQVINGMHKNVISITTISNGGSSSSSSSGTSSNQPVPIKLPQQTQSSHSKILTTASVTVTPAAVTSCAVLPPQVISWTQAQNSIASPAQHQNFKQHSLQTEQQQKQNQQHHQQMPFTALSSNGSPQNLHNPSVLLPPSNFHQNTLAQHIQKVGSTLSNSTNSTMPLHCSRPHHQQPLHQQQYSRAAVHSHNSQLKVFHNSTSSNATPHTVLSSNQSKQNHSDLNEIPASVIYRSPIKGESGLSSGGSRERSIEVTAQSSALHLNSVDLNDKKVVFATPAKRDSRVLSSSAKKSLKSLISGGVPGKVKRSQKNQISHHDAVEGILSSPLTTTSYPPSLSLSAPSIRRRWKIRRNSDEWHAPDTYIFDSVSPLTSLNERRQRSMEKCDSTIAAARVSCIQQHWLGVYDVKDSSEVSPRMLNIGREERIERHKALLRRQAVQMVSSQHFLKPTSARNRLVLVSKCLKKLKSREDSLPAKKCCISSCTNYALALTAQCYMHITRNIDQHLFLPCTAKFADNTQCRIPVFDISHELPLCREHGWKRDNYNRIVQEQRPKTKIPRKPTKSVVVCGRPPKRNKKKRKGSTSSLESIASSNTVTVSSASTTPVINSSAPVAQTTLSNVIPSMVIDGNMSVAMTENGYHLKANDIMQANMLSDVQNIIRHQSQQDLFTQDMLSICDNSSMYASSEDTGVGGLSESELMVGTQDAEEIPLGDDITNVLNNLPVDTFTELFTVVHQDEREEVERALELADKQIKSLQQMTASDADFLRDFLDDNDQILEDTDITGILPSPSPDTSGIDTNTLFVDGGSNSTAGSCTGPTPTDIRGLVQT